MELDTQDVSKHAVEGLKSQPAFFALLAVCVVTFGLVYMATQAQQDRELERFNKLLERCNFQQYGGPRA